MPPRVDRGGTSTREATSTPIPQPALTPPTISGPSRDEVLAKAARMQRALLDRDPGPSASRAWGELRAIRAKIDAASTPEQIKHASRLLEQWAERYVR